MENMENIERKKNKINKSIAVMPITFKVMNKLVAIGVYKTKAQLIRSAIRGYIGIHKDELAKISPDYIDKLFNSEKEVIYHD